VGPVPPPRRSLMGIVSHVSVVGLKRRTCEVIGSPLKLGSPFAGSKHFYLVKSFAVRCGWMVETFYFSVFPMPLR